MAWLLFTAVLACGGSRDAPSLEKHTPTMTPIVPPDPPEKSIPPPPKRVLARHILIAHADSIGAESKTRRSKLEARLKAEETLYQAQAKMDFTELARTRSDGPTALRGGVLGVFERGSMVKEFEDLAFALDIDQIAMVETQYGYHVVQRLALEEVYLVHIIVQWRGAVSSKAKRRRSDARKKIEKVRKKLLLGSSPKTVAKKYSDGPFGKRGGEVGWFQKDQLNPILEDAAFKLDVAEISSIVETPMGFHLLIREK